MQTVGLIFGGKSGEHDISIASARAIASGLPEYKVLPFYIDRCGFWHHPRESAAVLYEDNFTLLSSLDQFCLPEEIKAVDIWFPVLHGPNGEDGTVQGLLTLMQKPFVGSGVLASAIGMDKIVMKSLFARAGIPQVNYLACNRYQWYRQPTLWQEKVELELQYPCFVKPSNMGSSVGISKVRNRAELVAAVELALQYDNRFLIEQGVIAREIECAVLGNDQPLASPVGEITYSSDFYDYDTKYTPGKADLIIPAALPQAVVEIVQELSLKAFQTIGARGLARVDFFYVEAAATVLLNEINTMPGFTQTSMYPKLWSAQGLSFTALCARLVELAQEEYAKIKR
ncbi:MAG: D-alanine--D-alanine ligase family protein [Pseudanabaenaceae cyanobacterium SKYGB_i_bin29]|nr:D-alanine--D-alanine ligase [Pseudanabaenaceae cyanobacterium SKYG29]MDW8422408.1 D-alanine--D-alanine ligase family protein [Pseudanabaenaceae cyanobacterium SKYGB_i_bin29]